ncbi:MAG: glycosyltransferase family 4 protein [Candidatus Omnitrophica bacterium]|nr:glycosyltransferase family 4 protein [Candidatus Omnitrophota bacterium]
MTLTSKTSEKEKMKLTLIYNTDPRIDVLGGGVRKIRFLMEAALDDGIDVKYIGVDLAGVKEEKTGLEFIPVVKGSDKWWRFFLCTLEKAPFMKISRLEVMHTQRLIYLLPFVIFHPGNVKVFDSDMPMLTAMKVYPPWLYAIISAVFPHVERFLLNRVDAVLAHKEVLKDYYEARYPEHKKKFRYDIDPAVGIDGKFFYPGNPGASRDALAIPRDEKVIIFVGRLSVIKRVDLLIDMFGEILKITGNARFIIIGRGESEEKFRDHAARKNYPNIYFAGEKHGMELAGYYRSADVLVLGSVTEGTPAVVREALSSGVPVVSNDVGDTGAIIDHPLLGKVLARDASAQDLAKAVIGVLSMDREKVRAACVERARSFSVKAMFASTLAMYRELMEARHGKG